MCKNKKEKADISMDPQKEILQQEGCKETCYLLQRLKITISESETYTTGVYTLICSHTFDLMCYNSIYILRELVIILRT